jgi:hypothetical protein
MSDWLHCAVPPAGAGAAACQVTQPADVSAVTYSNRSVTHWLHARFHLQALVLLHVKSRSLLTSAQYLQLVTARACEVPACLPHALHTLLALLQVRGVFIKQTTHQRVTVLQAA